AYPARPSFPTRRSSDLVHPREARGEKLDHRAIIVVQRRPGKETGRQGEVAKIQHGDRPRGAEQRVATPVGEPTQPPSDAVKVERSEEHTSELQSRGQLV